MSNSASIKGPPRVRPARALDLPQSTRPAPPPLPIRTPAAFAKTIASPIGQRGIAVAPASVPAIRVGVRPPAPAPLMSPSAEKALGQTMKIVRPSPTPPEAADAHSNAWRPFRGFLIGASLGALLMVGLTGSGSVHDSRAWLAASLRAMKHAPPAAPAAAPAAPAPLPMVVEVPAVKPGALPPCPPLVTQAETAAESAIPTMDVADLPRVKPSPAWRPAPKRTAPSSETPADDSADDRSGDEATVSPSLFILREAPRPPSLQKVSFSLAKRAARSAPGARAKAR